MPYEVIKNNKPTGIFIEAESVFGACIKYSQMPQDTRQYNVPCVTIYFKKVEGSFTEKHQLQP